jgi:very-short-patch-repair endonuclease
MSYGTPQYVTDLARKMRKEPTHEEVVLWEAVRNNKLGVKFRNQHPLGRYIADLYCHQKKLVIEIDGSIHDLPDVIEYDKIRQREIESRGLKILRVRNEEIRENLQGVIEKITKAME